MAINIFISYSHADELYKNDLVNHLSGLKRSGIINDWDDRKILPGEKWDEEIKKHFKDSKLVLFLVSSDFMASDYIQDIEIRTAIEKHERGEITIVPIIIRDCDYTSLSLSKFQALPKNAKPISSWENKDEGWANVVQQLKKIINPDSKNEIQDFVSQYSTTPKNHSRHFKIIGLIILVLIILYFIIFRAGNEVTGIKGDNNDNNKIEITK
ncbi:MAG: toll/interleukin-1 receptor domain-containing protein [Bacteroidota bacterium]|nr:toll/interleukin-1 receptor domain-containing protein [Bacteroidota bacterium]